MTAETAPKEPTTEIVQFDGLVMRTTPKEAIDRFHRLQVFVKECMNGPEFGPDPEDAREAAAENREPRQIVVRDGLDYGIIPGTKKLTLYKPGAEKLTEIYGLGWRYRWVEKQLDWKNGFFYFEVECVVFDAATGRELGNCIASCNSREDKYAWRWMWPDAAQREGVDVRNLKVKKVGRKGHTMVRVPNEDICSTVNTLQKMAQKRSLVGAVIAATRSGGLFTQDFDSMSDATVSRLIDDDERADYRGASATDKRAMIVDKLREKLKAATTDAECVTVGREMVEARRDISAADEQILRAEIHARREEPAIKATAKKAEPKADAPAAQDAPKAPTSDPEKKSAPAAAAEPPPAPKSEPKAAQPPQKRTWEACGAENDGCTCTRPKGHDAGHYDEKTESEWGGS